MKGRPVRALAPVSLAIAASSPCLPAIACAGAGPMPSHRCRRLGHRDVGVDNVLVQSGNAVGLVSVLVPGATPK